LVIVSWILKTIISLAIVSIIILVELRLIVAIVLWWSSTLLRSLLLVEFLYTVIHRFLFW
jgi:hypothetical protein